MSYYAIVTILKDVRKHPNADRLQLATVFGNTVCVSMEYTEGQVGVYFPTGGQLSVAFAEANNLLRKKDAEGNNIGGYMDPDKRNITAIKLRGEKSDGLFLPLSCLETFGDVKKLSVGDRIDVFNGHEICVKYIPKTSARRGHVSNGNKTRNHKVPLAPTFAEHADTEQLAYNLGAFKVGDELEFTLKMHGTSQRTGHLKVLTGYKRTLWDKLLKKQGTPVYDWGYVSGTRRVVLDSFDGGFYGSNEFRKQYHDFFDGKLLKGETVYYEIVGFTHDGASIMGQCSNKKLNDKEFVKQYGETTTFSYGCAPSPLYEVITHTDGSTEQRVLKPQSRIFVYRMTMTNEDGEVVEYTPDQVRHRCMYMGADFVPVEWSGLIPENPGSKDDPTITAGEWILKKAEQFYDGPEPLDPTHIREGVVVRIINRPTFTAYKHKNFSFKVLEGIIKDTADAPDMEEADGLEEEVMDSN